MSMKNIDLHDIACFGFTLPKDLSWYVLLHTVSTDGWKAIDEVAFEKSFSKNITSSYENMISISFKDLDTDFTYLCGFDNNAKLWKLEMPGSPSDVISNDDYKAFFKSEVFKKICKRADAVLTNALNSCTKYVMPEIKQGKFIEVDTIKLEAILYMLNDSIFRKNLKTGKYMH